MPDFKGQGHDQVKVKLEIVLKLEILLTYGTYKCISRLKNGF